MLTPRLTVRAKNANAPNKSGRLLITAQILNKRPGRQTFR